MIDFIIHSDYGKTLKGMSNEEVGELIKALISHTEGEEPKVTSPTVKAVFPIMSDHIDRDIAYRKKASEYGKKGGAPFGNSNAKTRVNKGNTRVIQGSDKGKQTPKPKPKPNPNIKDILSFLNDKTGRHFRESKETERLINARLDEGYTVDDFKTVIEKKVKAWKNDPKMHEFLRPSTLFAPSHFDKYLNAPEGKVVQFSGENAKNQFNRFAQRTDDIDYDKLIKN